MLTCGALSSAPRLPGAQDTARAVLDAPAQFGNQVVCLGGLSLSQDTVNVLPAIGGVVYLVGPVAPAPFYSRGLRSVCYNFLGERCQRLSAPITQTALNAAYSELRRLIEEVLRSGYSKENVQSELIKGLVLESGMAPPALDDIAGDGIRLPR